jgi:serine/threonine protein kinase
MTVNHNPIIVDNKYKLLNVIGMGSFSQVHAVADLHLDLHHHAHNPSFLDMHNNNHFHNQTPSSANLAVKVVSISNSGAKNLDNEAECWKLIHGHQNIVSLHRIIRTDSHIFFLQERVHGKELYDAILDAHGMNGGLDIGLSLPQCKKYFAQLISAIDHMHSRGVAHRDIKLENILIDDSTDSVKLIDFGFSTTQLMSNCKSGTVDYLAPEVFTAARDGNEFDALKVDMWACGVVLYAMLTAQLPFSADNQTQKRGNILRGYFRFPNSVPLDAQELVKGLLNVNPSRRLSFHQIREHPFMSSHFNDSQDIVSASLETERKLTDCEV